MDRNVGELESHDDDLIPELAHVGGRPVEGDDAGSALSGKGVGLEAVAVVHIGYQNLLSSTVMLPS